MSRGYDPIFVIPLVLIVGSGDMDDAVCSAVSGTFRKKIWLVGV